MTADRDHRYGHDKAEYFASGVEGVLILLAAASILVTAVPRLFAPAPLVNLGIGLVVSLLNVRYLVVGQPMPPEQVTRRDDVGVLGSIRWHDVVYPSAEFAEVIRDVAAVWLMAEELRLGWGERLGDEDGVLRDELRLTCGGKGH